MSNVPLSLRKKYVLAHLDYILCDLLEKYGFVTTEFLHQQYDEISKTSLQDDLTTFQIDLPSFIGQLLWSPVIVLNNEKCSGFLRRDYINQKTVPLTTSLSNASHLDEDCDSAICTHSSLASSCSIDLVCLDNGSRGGSPGVNENESQNQPADEIMSEDKLDHQKEELLAAEPSFYDPNKKKSSGQPLLVCNSQLMQCHPEVYYHSRIHGADRLIQPYFNYPYAYVVPADSSDWLFDGDVPLFPLPSTFNPATYYFQKSEKQPQLTPKPKKILSVTRPVPRSTPQIPKKTFFSEPTNITCLNSKLIHNSCKLAMQKEKLIRVQMQANSDAEECKTFSSKTSDLGEKEIAAEVANLMLDLITFIDKVQLPSKLERCKTQGRSCLKMPALIHQENTLSSNGSGDSVNIKKTKEKVIVSQDVEEIETLSWTTIVELTKNITSYTQEMSKHFYNTFFGWCFEEDLLDSKSTNYY